MLCAFTSYKEFQTYLRTFQELASSHADAFVFHARVPLPASPATIDEGNTDPEDAKTSYSIDHIESSFHSSFHQFYGFGVQQSKIQVRKEWRDFAELLNTFPSLPADLLESVWEQQGHSWQSCLQILSSLLLSKEKAFLPDYSLLLEGDQWPHLSTPSNSHQLGYRAGEEWTIIGLESYLSSGSQVLNDWELVKRSLPSAKSYRDILTSTTTKEVLEVVSPSPPGLKLREAQPCPARSVKIAVGPPIPPIRRDRVYVNTKLSAAQMLGLPCDIQLTDEEVLYLRSLQEEEEEMEWEACCNGKFAAQSSVTLKRKSSLIHVRPNTFEQKLKRIAMKMK